MLMQRGCCFYDPLSRRLWPWDLVAYLGTRGSGASWSWFSYHVELGFPVIRLLLEDEEEEREKDKKMEERAL